VASNHALKNVGIDIFKPDIHVRRTLSRLGLIRCEHVSTTEICIVMSFLSGVSDMKISELDTLLFVYGKATGDNVNISCAPALKGYQIVKLLGAVHGLTVRTRGVGGKIVAGIEGMFGGEVASYSSEAEKARRDCARILTEPYGFPYRFPCPSE
jgi:hypothetical protein